MRASSQGKSLGAVGSALLKVVDGQSSSFVPDLVHLVNDYANSKSLEDRIAISNATELGRVLAMSFLTLDMGILANADSAVERVLVVVAAPLPPTSGSCSPSHNQRIMFPLP